MIGLGDRVGQYVIEKELGQGGMGVVYIARHILLGRLFALKTLLPPFTVHQEVLARFFNEARAATLIGHPGIVEVIDFGHHTDGTHYFVMELLQGESLASRLKKDGRLSPEAVVAIAAQLSDILAAAHAKGIIHRDLKPDNIFLVPDRFMPFGTRAKVLDFGIAKLAQDSGPVATGSQAILGTPIYMSPEQCRGDTKLVDARSDVYTLGVILYEMSTGALPFRGRASGDYLAAHLRDIPAPPWTVDASVPHALGALILKCLNKDPCDRYQSMIDLGHALAALAGPSSQWPAVDLPVTGMMPGGTAPASPKALQAAGAPQLPPTTLRHAASQAVAAPVPVGRSRRPVFAGAVLLAIGAAVFGIVLATQGGGKTATGAQGTTTPLESAPLPDGSTAVPATPAGRVTNPSQATTASVDAGIGHVDSRPGVEATGPAITSDRGASIDAGSLTSKPVTAERPKPTRPRRDPPRPNAQSERPHASPAPTTTPRPTGDSLVEPEFEN